MNLALILSKVGQTGTLKKDICEFIEKANSKKTDKHLLTIEMMSALNSNALSQYDESMFVTLYEHAELNGITVENIRQTIKDGSELIAFIKKDNPYFNYAWFSSLTGYDTDTIKKHMDNKEHEVLLYNSICSYHKNEYYQDKVFGLAARPGILFLSIFLSCAESEWREAAMNGKMRTLKDELCLALGNDFFEKGSMKTRRNYFEIELGL